LMFMIWNGSKGPFHWCLWWDKTDHRAHSLMFMGWNGSKGPFLLCLWWDGTNNRVHSLMFMMRWNGS
jgi:hypothetical protein